MITLEFLLTSLIVVLIPGTGVIYTVSTGLSLGRRASIRAAIGCTAGIVPHLLASVFGLAAILHMSALAFSFLKFAGAAYLLYLACLTWRDKKAFAVDAHSRDGRQRNIALRAFLLNILNPKLSIFFLAFLPQFVTAQTPSPLLQLLMQSAIFMFMTFIVFAAYGFLADGFRARVIDSPATQSWLRSGFAAALAGLGIKLALSER